MALLAWLRYIGRIKLPRKQLPESELAEKENRPTGKIVGKKKKWADEEEDDKNFEYVDELRVEDDDDD